MEVIKIQLSRKKGQAGVGALQGFVITLGIIAIVLAITLTVVNNLGDEMEADSYAANSTLEMEEEIGGISGWMGIIVLVVIAVVILSVVMVIKRFG